MENFQYIHLSNRTEKLYFELKKRLFANSHPFTQRIIIVPSAAMKSWLMLKMAEDPELGVSTGIEIGFIDPTINALILLLDEKNQKNISYEPSKLELALVLEDILVALPKDFFSFTKSNQLAWLPLLEYLGIKIDEEKKISMRILKRIQALSNALTSIFCDYGIYGEAIIAEWKSNPGVTGWQKLLWEKIESTFDSWNYPFKKIQSFQFSRHPDPQEIQIHLFGLSFLAPIHHSFFQKVSSELPVYYYLLSPCQKFWGDVLSDKESQHLKNFWKSQKANDGSLEALEDLLRDKNPLLANFGRLGREMSLQTEALGSFVNEVYSLPETILTFPEYNDLYSEEIILESSSHPLTMLEAIQADIALLKSPETEMKIDFDEYDETVQVHAVPKKSREVQVIYDVLMSILDKHSKDAVPILPEDIFVMVPNVSEYSPFIRSVFESSESQLAVQLMDQQIPAQHLVIQGFLHLLSLFKGRWEASALLQLFDYKAFRLRHRLSDADILVIRRWIKEVGIYWGKDSHHRAELFKRDYHDKMNGGESEIGTWEYGLGRLLEGLAMLEIDPLNSFTEEGKSFCPMDRIEMSQGHLLGNILHLIRSLQSDLKPLMDGTKFSLEDWSTYLKCLYDGYFIPSDEEGELEAYEILKGHLEQFSKASSKLKESMFGFETIYKHLNQLLTEETAIYKESNIQAVRFSSLLPMRAVPAKVVVLMGMGEGLFPRLNQENTLNLLLENSKADYYPSQVDLDRYIFLEAILSARKYFILSYISQEPGEVTTQSPSLVIKELIHYLDQSYRIFQDQIYEKPSKFCLYFHPLIPFHHSYFTGGILKSFSHSNYLAALSYYQCEKKPQHTFLSEFLPISETFNNFTERMIVDLKDLLAFSKSPLKVYVNQVLGIYLDNEADRSIQDEEDLFISDLNAFILLRRGLFNSKSNVLKMGENSGQIPHGPFKKIAIEKIEYEIEQMLDNLKRCEIDPKQLFMIELAEHFNEPHFSNDKWMFPALTLEISGLGMIKLVGSLENICEKGMVLINQDNTEKILELWPACLVFRTLIEKYTLPIMSQLIFVKGKKSKIRNIISEGNLNSAKKALENYLRYFLRAKIQPSPFIPDLIPSIYSGDKDKLKNIFKENEEDFFPKFDQYSNWFERNSPFAGLEMHLDHWKITAQNLFVDALCEGKTKKTAEFQENKNDLI